MSGRGDSQRSRAGGWWRQGWGQGRGCWVLLLVGALLLGVGATRGHAAGTAAGRAPLELRLGGVGTGGGVVVQRLADDTDKAGVLKVHNRTSFVVILHIGGVRVGWLRPQRTGVIRGLASGYHELYAHSRYGSISWGPKEIWIPGDWNLVQ